MVGATEGRSNITILLDNVVEGLENFNMKLSLVTNNPQITLGRDRSKGQIIDSTGKCNKLMYVCQ